MAAIVRATIPHLTLVLILLLPACSAGSPPSAGTRTGVAGTWVMRLDAQPLMVLTLRETGDALQGTLARPRRMTSDGRTFSGVAADTITVPVSGSTSDDGTVHLTTAHPDTGEKTMLEFRVTSPDEAGLVPTGAPFEPWPLTRHTSGETPAVWTGWDPTRAYAVAPPYVRPNPAMAAIYAADQAVRQSLETFRRDAARIATEDAARRTQVRELLAKGELRAGEDFRLAAFVFQHGERPDDYLLAHTLALVALAKGDRSAAWIAAATLDRYLNAVGRSQIYGTGLSLDGVSRPAFDPDLVPDSVRRELGVPSAAEQDAQLPARNMAVERSSSD